MPNAIFMMQHCLSEKSWPNLYCNLLYELGQDFLDIQRVSVPPAECCPARAADTPAIVQPKGEKLKVKDQNNSYRKVLKRHTKSVCFSENHFVQKTIFGYILIYFISI